MSRNEDELLEVLTRCWNEKRGTLDTDRLIKSLETEDAVGDFCAEVLTSRLLGWQRIVADLLRDILTQHLAPPTIWLESVWYYAQAAITSDPDEIMRVFGLLRRARADAVRQWMAEPLVLLAERRSETHKWLGFEGLGYLISSGGATHLERFATRIRLAGLETESGDIREASAHVLKILGSQPDPELSAPDIKKTFPKPDNSVIKQTFANLSFIPSIALQGTI
jgi:hypothetical protein